MGGVALQQITAELDARVLSEHVLAEALHHPAAVEALRQTKRAVALTDILAHQDNAAHNGVIAVRRQITAVLDARVHLEPVDKITKNMTRGAVRENVMFLGDVIDNVVRPLCSFSLPLVHSLKMNDIYIYVTWTYTGVCEAVAWGTLMSQRTPWSRGCYGSSI
jgi:hypothetical protein